MTETTDATGPELDVTIPDDLLARMYKDRIVEDNVYKVIEHSETTDEVVYDPGRDLFIGHLRIGLITYWVEYAKTDEGIVVHDVFSHRLEILDREGAV